MEIVRLHLARIDSLNRIPVHGFVIKHPRAGAILVDTGVGWPTELVKEWKVVNRHAADALAEHDLSPADVRIVINTHLHFDHCGQNAVFKHAPFYVQRRRSWSARAARKRSPLNGSISRAPASSWLTVTPRWPRVFAWSRPPGTPPAIRACWSIRPTAVP
jgi:Metallo-beta-lactamase superfamily.